jgi:transcriptional regulator with XRE-family HTH domain
MSFNPVYCRLCDELRRARLDAHLSEADLAERIGESPGYIADYERGRRTLLIEELLRITHHLGTGAGGMLQSASRESHAYDEAILQ